MRELLRRISGHSTAITGTVVAALLFSASLTGCDRRQKVAVGDPNQIMVYSDKQNWDLYGSQLSAIFERVVETPRTELIFSLRNMNPDVWKYMPRFKNLLICAPLEDLTPTATRIKELLSPEVRQLIYNNQQGLHVVQEDIYAFKQLFLIITADTREHLVDYLQSNRELLFRIMEERLNDRISDLIYRTERDFQEQYALEDTLYNDYQFTMRMPWGFLMNTDYASESFVRMIKFGPERWFFAHWTPIGELDDQELGWIGRLDGIGEMIDQGADPDPVEIRRLAQQSWDYRDEICRNYYDGDQVNRNRTMGTVVDFGGRWAMRLDGMWENDEEFVGGPMVAYCFIDRDTGRFWWLDGAVFYPNEPKETLVRQLDVMIRTFMTGPEAREYIASIQEKIDGSR